MANPERKQLFSGARADIIARGQKVGWAMGCSGGRVYQRQKVQVFGNLHTEEHALVGYDVQVQLDVMGLVSQSLVTAGLLPAVGQSNEEHLENAIAMDPFLLQVIDKITGKPRWEIAECEIENENFSFSARSLMSLNISIVGIYMKDLAEL